MAKRPSTFARLPLDLHCCAATKMLLRAAGANGSLGKMLIPVARKHGVKLINVSTCFDQTV